MRLHCSLADASCVANRVCTFAETLLLSADEDCSTIVDADDFSFTGEQHLTSLQQQGRQAAVCVLPDYSFVTLFLTRLATAFSEHPSQFAQVGSVKHRQHLHSRHSQSSGWPKHLTCTSVALHQQCRACCNRILCAANPVGLRVHSIMSRCSIAPRGLEVGSIRSCCRPCDAFSF